MDVLCNLRYEFVGAFCKGQPGNRISLGGTTGLPITELVTFIYEHCTRSPLHPDRKR